MESFHFLAPAYALAFVFHTCEPGQRKCKCKHKMENTRSMPSRFEFKPKWRPPTVTSDEKRAESVTKYLVLYDESCAGFREKLKQTTCMD